MNLKNIIFLTQFALSPVLVAGIPSDERATEILKFCFIGEDGGIGYRREGNLSLDDRKDFHAWFQRKDDPLASINELVSDDTMRARAVIVASAFLDDDHFYRVSLNVLERFADGKASEKELKGILTPHQDKIGLLAVHFRDVLLRSKLKKCLDRGISDPAYINIVKNILSGDGAKDVSKYTGNVFPQRYGPLAEQAINDDPSVYGSKKPWINLQKAKTMVHAVGFQWLWLVGAVALGLVTWFVLKHRS